jgi:hypothetical protein
MPWCGAFAMAAMSAPESIERPQTDEREGESAQESRAIGDITAGSSIDTPGVPTHYSRHWRIGRLILRKLCLPFRCKQTES